jgi:hypothetical protein
MIFQDLVGQALYGKTDLVFVQNRFQGGNFDKNTIEEGIGKRGIGNWGFLPQRRENAEDPRKG